jgi:long-chain alkane monooxygenase
MPKELLVNSFYSASPSQSWAGMWAHPRSTGANYNELSFWLELGLVCERALLDGLFLADPLAIAAAYEGSPAAMLQAGCFTPALDPALVIPAIATVTSNLGFGLTGNTTYEPPYSLARRFSTLDHLTRGRVAWNVVTGLHDETSRAFGLDAHAEHDDRYAAAHEYIDLTYKLWEGSWADDAPKRDRERRVFTDPTRVRAIAHEGPRYHCHGVHLCEPSLQRTPLIFSAGTSPSGLAFAAKHSECIFMSSGSRDKAAERVKKLRAMAQSCGRSPSDVKVFLGATIIVGETDAEAQDKLEDYAQYCDPRGTLAFMSGFLGTDLSRFKLDDPVPSFKTNASQGAVASLVESGKVWRIRDLCAFAPAGDQGLFLVGGKTRIADCLLQWAQETDIDGLNLLRTVEPEGLKAFCDLVVPELQDRGIFKTRYREGTLREKFFPESGGRLPANHPADQYRFR